MDGYRTQLAADVKRWDYPETLFMDIGISGEVRSRNSWDVDIIFEGFEEPETQNFAQTLIVPVVSIVFQIPVEKTDRLHFHCSPDEDGLLAAVWRLEHDGRRAQRIAAPLKTSDAEAWGADDGAPAKMWLVEIQLAVGTYFGDRALGYGQ